MRILFATLPAYGHAAPLASIAAELAARGHPVGWVAHAELRGRLLPADAPVWETPGAAAVHAEPRTDRPGAAVRAWFGELVPAVTHAQVPMVEAAIAAFRPDVMVVEQNCLAGSIGARRGGLPWVSVHVTPTFLLQPFRVLPSVEAWIDRELGQVQRVWGVEPLPHPLRSPFGTLVASSAAFLGPEADLRPTDTLVGALTSHRDGDLDPAWLGPRPRSLVSLGTLTGPAGRSFLERATEGLASLGTVIAVSPEPFAAPDGVVVAPWVPLPALLPHLDLVVAHGGQGTVTECLLHGVPMVLAPIQFDQPVVAARVAALGAGRVVSFARATPEELRDAARDVLKTPSYAEAARRVGATLGPGTSAAADFVLAVGR